MLGLYKSPAHNGYYVAVDSKRGFYILPFSLVTSGDSNIGIDIDRFGYYYVRPL